MKEEEEEEEEEKETGPETRTGNPPSIDIATVPFSAACVPCRCHIC